MTRVSFGGKTCTSQNYIQVRGKYRKEDENVRGKKRQRERKGERILGAENPKEVKVKSKSKALQTFIQMARQGLDVDDEFYSDPIESSEFDDSDKMERGRNLGGEGFEEDDRIEQDNDGFEYFNSHRKFRKIESSQESYTQNSHFNYLNSEIEDINSRIESISSNIENIIMDSGHVTDPVCILEQVPFADHNHSSKNVFVQVGSCGLKIGRSSDCDFPGNLAPSKDLLRLSRSHAYIYVKKTDQGKNQIHIVDCNSANGTFVNNVKIKSQILKQNDILSFGCADLDDQEVRRLLNHECGWRFKVIMQ